MFSIENLRLALSDKWQSFGQVNQVLIVFSGILVLGLSVSMFMFAKQQHDLRNIKCLAMNVYHEARGEPILGQYAVAAVTMNRVNSTRYPDDVCRVVYQKGWSSRQQRYVAAFSWTLDKLADIPKESLAWKKAVDVAEAVYQEEESAKTRVKNAMYYHAEYVKPRWASQKLRITKIGRHIFYK
ncbi:cell wall hydrolase [Kaarinaea lacus]